MAADPTPSFENTIRLYDAAVSAWLSGCTFDYGDLGGAPKPNFPLIHTIASPHRAFAQISDLLVKLNFLSADNPAAQVQRAQQDWAVLPLPLATIDRDDPIIDNTLANPSATIPRAYVDEDGNTWEMPYPLQYITQYRITFWCDKRFTHARFMEWILGQLGHRGAAQSELFLRVTHNAPWGEQLHQFRYIGSADLSDLEGDGVRYIRSMVSFNLRSWFFRPAVDKAPLVYTPQQDWKESMTQPVSGEVFYDSGRWSTGNLFPREAWEDDRRRAAWPITPFVDISASEPPAVNAVFHGEDAAVPLAAVDVVPDDFGRGVYGVAFTVGNSAGPSKIVARQFTKAPGDPVVVASIQLPIGDNLLHRFFVVDSDQMQLTLEADGAYANTTLSNIDVRQLTARDRIAFAETETIGSDTHFVWRNLPRQPFLVVGFGIVGSATVRVDSDATAPAGSNSEFISEDARRGFALLTMPDSDSFRLVIPTTLAVTTIYAQSFDGPYRGSSI